LVFCKKRLAGFDSERAVVTISQRAGVVNVPACDLIHVIGAAIRLLRGFSPSPKGRYTRALLVVETKRPLLRHIQSDARADAYFLAWLRARFDIEVVAPQVKTVTASIDAKRSSEVAWSAGERLYRNLDASIAAHDVNSRDGFECAYQDGGTNPGRLGRDVEAKIHAIYKVDIRIARPAEQRGSSSSWSAVPMACWIDKWQVCFCFHDAPGKCQRLPSVVRKAAVESRSDKTASDVNGRSGKELLRVVLFRANISSHLTSRPSCVMIVPTT
jgi:hypothetical protein